MKMNFDDIFSRTDEMSLQEILGSPTIRILTTLDETKSYNKYLKKLVLDLYGPEGILLDKRFRNILFDLLRENEAKNLATILGINYSNTNELFKRLKKGSFKRGSSNEDYLFKFFNLIAPRVESIDVISTIECEPRYQLFKHQRIAAKKVRFLLEKEPNRVLLHMPTGSGKTRTAMDIISEHLRDNESTLVIWLASSEELCEQAVEEFNIAWSFLGNRSVQLHRVWGDYNLEINKVNDGIIVGGFAKFTNMIRKANGIGLIGKLATKCSLVVMDEAHQAIAPSYKLILDTLFSVGKENRLLGLSATPGRTWNNIDADAELANFFNRTKVKLEIEGYDNPIDYLTEEGYLARVEYRQLLHSNGIISEHDLQEITDSTDVPIHVLKKLGQDEQRNLKIIYEVEKLAVNHRRIILFAPSVESSNLLACVLQARNYEAYSITGETPHTRRVQYINNFKDHQDKVKILCNYGVLTTGFDAPQISAGLIARPTLSLVLYSQMVGRAIRGTKAGGNLEAEIVTIVDTELPGFKSIAESFNNWEDVWE